MGFYIRALANKKKEPKWKIQFISYSKKDCEGLNSNKKQWDLHKERSSPLGFNSSMTLKQARARSKQLNSINNIEKQEERILKLRVEKFELHLSNNAFLSE